VNCTFVESAQAVSIEPSAAAQFYRIGQEAVTNALKHGQPRKIQISLQALPGRTELCISDDGRGFTQGQNQSHGLGLQAMKYRADTLGAELKIESHPGRGTSITCALVKKV